MDAVWVDLDNPPQVQYLLPFADAFRERGVEVVVTARDYGNAIELLRQRGASFHAIGSESGASTLSKAAGVLGRARGLVSLFGRLGRPAVLLAASRSSALAARWLGIDLFIVGDYERANRSFYRLTRSYMLYPDVIDPSAFREAGLRADRLIPFHGLKEDVTFAALDLDVPAARFPQIEDAGIVRVLFRPPAEQSHYYDPRSRRLALSALEYLAARPECVVVFAPRHAWQRADLEGFAWRRPPIVLDRALPPVALLKAVDLVVSAGGTMLREAAYLGIPAYSIFGSRIGDVDRHLASIGRLTLISTPAELAQIKLLKAPALEPLRTNPRLLEQLVEMILEHAGIDAEPRMAHELV